MDNEKRKETANSGQMQRLVMPKLIKAKEAKKKHKDSNQCEAKDGKGCTACHFWSGSISALSGLIGKPGIID